MGLSLQIGDVEVVAVQDREHHFSREWHFPGVPEEAWEPYRDLISGPDGYVMLNFACFLIREEGRTLLIDTGWGPEMGPPGAAATPARLLEELTVHGVGVSDIDTVAFTHLHPDHVGWNLVTEGESIRARFDRARYLVPRSDWEHYSSLDEMHPNIRQQALPLSNLGVMDLFDGETTLSPSVTSLPTPGHTPGHTSFVVMSGSEKLFILGDLAHHPVIINEPDWVQRFDQNPEQNSLTRKRIFSQLEQDQTLVAAGHFQYPGVGRFARVDGRRVWKPL